MTAIRGCLLGIAKRSVAPRSYTYEVAPYDMKIGHCSCRTCRKAHAAPFAATARVPRENFRFLAGEDKIRFKLFDTLQDTQGVHAEMRKRLADQL